MKCQKSCQAYCSVEHYMTKLGPVVFGNKPLHVFTMRKGIDQFAEALSHCNRIKFEIIHASKGMKVLVYNEANCLRVLQDKRNLNFLRSEGFEMTLQDYIYYFVCALERNEMPHIMGLFFGYPLKDVLGFMGNPKLKKTKVQGWCVFGDPKVSDRVYHSFTKAEEKMKYLLSRKGLPGLTLV